MLRFHAVHTVTFIVAMTLVSCTLTPQTAEEVFFQTEPYAPYKPYLEGTPFAVNDYQDKNEGAPLPAWVDAWLEGGARMIETLPEYRGLYCFVMEQPGRELTALQHWAARFNLERNFPKMALQRIFKRWTDNLTSSPDLVYGSYFEKMLKASAAFFWQNAKFDAQCWLLVRYANDSAALNENLEQTDLYRMLILAVIDIKTFQNELTILFNNIAFERTDSRAQIAATSQMLSTFWQGF
ncbi:MAG: hypothetical protein LBD22_01815 [Spirochaetaceae bacterium]|jgi:hypothetical protein|nr:hypothetical protein [Spirochaetaceae bacterium]